MYQQPIAPILQPNLLTTTDSSQTDQNSKLKYCASILGIFSFGLFATSIIVITVFESKDEVSFRILAAVLLLTSLNLAWVAYRLYWNVKAPSPCTESTRLEAGSRWQNSAQDRNAMPSIVLENQACVTDDVNGSNLQGQREMIDAPPPYEEGLDPSQLHGAHGYGQFFLELNTCNINPSMRNNDLSYLPSYDEAIMSKSVQQGGTR